MPPAQIYHALDSARGQEPPQHPAMQLRRARGFAGNDPMKICERVGGRAHRIQKRIAANL